MLRAWFCAVIGPSILIAAEPARLSYLDNGQIRLGVDLELGGAITWLSRSGSKDSVINVHDWGREIQMSFYSGPVPFSAEGQQPHSAWTHLGWNPIQAGDVARNRSRIVAHSNDGKTITVRCIPMQWPLANVPGDCEFESRITLEGNTAEVTATLRNHRADRTQYPARHQELPAVYTVGTLHRLITYTGDQPFTGAATTTIVKSPAEQQRTKFPWASFAATETWAALVDDQGWGLGLWAPEVHDWLGGFVGKPGSGGPADAATGYLAPVRFEILDHDITYAYRYVVILGTLAEIRARVTALASPPRPPTWEFTADRQHWYLKDGTDAGWPITGALRVTRTTQEPKLYSPRGLWSAATAPILTVRGAWTTRATSARIWWRTPSDDFSPARMTTFPIVGDGAQRTVRIDLSRVPTWQGMITALRCDPLVGGAPGDWVDLAAIGFEPVPPR